MPTPLDVLKQLTEDVRALTERVKALEDVPPAFNWDAQILDDDPFDDDPFDDIPAAAAVRQAEITDGDVVLAPPTAQQEALREDLLDRLELENLPAEHGLSRGDAGLAYISGGPMWLYHFDREFLMSLSADVRRAMVDDVAAGGHQLETQEFARDVLKSDDPRRAAEVDLEHAGRAMEKRQ